jgi:hypothetical protein
MAEHMDWNVIQLLGKGHAFGSMQSIAKYERGNSSL